MRFTFTQSAMEKCLGRVIGAVAARAPMVTLNNIHLKLNGGRLEVTATDLEVIITASVDLLEAEGAGVFLMNAKRFMELIKELPDVLLELEVQNSERAVLKGQGVGVYTIPVGDPLDYPELPNVEAKQNFQLNAEIFKRMLSKTIFAVSHDDVRPVLTGLLMQIRTGELRIVATDGHRLSRIINNAVDYNGEPRDVIVPMKALSILQRNIADDEMVTIGFSETRAQFITEKQKLLTRLIDGNYPRYESVIPEQNKDKLTVRVGDFMAAVRRASIFASQISRQVLLTINPNEILLESEDPELGGRASETISAEFTSESLQTAYNWQYLIDGLKQIDTEEVVFQINGPEDAAIIRPSSQLEDEDFLMLLMPIRIR